MKLTRILRFHQKQLCHSEMRIDLMDLWIAHIYISAIHKSKKSAYRITKNNKRNYEYRLSISIRVKGVDAQSAQHRPVWSAVEVIPDNPSLSVKNMPLLRDKDGLLKYTKEPSFSKASPQPLSLFVSGRMTSICSPSRALQIRKV